MKSAHDLHDESIRYTYREHKIDKKRAWDLDEESMRSTKGKHEIYIQR